ncbi:unnamed protein product [Lactuca virosa]|uniref:Uncharacterized protein n=1 Tax=Lactuca virosa TaxID=75947 RepID=A0AAU9LHS1_9ASTR|nr:unnamed protein product [Lactuca virosa]
MTTTTGGSGSRENTQRASLATEEVVPNQPQRRRRGPNINKKASQILENQSDARITLTRDTYTKKFIGDSARSFAMEVGIVMRSFCQMEFHTWEKVAKENKEEMINRLRQYAEQMKHNQGKLVIPSRGGSRSIANHKFAMTNKETEMPPSPIELYHKLHFHPIKKWINDESRIQYVRMIS